MGLTRRNLLKGGLASGALLFARPVTSFADVLGPTDEFATDRASRLFDGTRVVHADLHNHSHLSDGAGDPRHAFASMRSAGLDVAALTDHSTVSWGAGSVVDVCEPIDGEPQHGERQDCRSVAGLDEERWRYAAALADAADTPGEFAALRGFEWSSPFLGHVNVWFSQRWIDPLHTAGIDSSGFGEHFRANSPDTFDAVGGLVDQVGYANPAHTGMLPFYEWLAADPSTPVVGGGADGLACFNHPGREAGRFSYFRHHDAVADRFVAMEILNRREDYLFKSHDHGQPSPLVQCLNAGWRVGLLGVTDEHGTDWGHPDGKGRAGLWVTDLSRAGVREALVARRFFATFLRGLRLDASARSLTAAPDGTAPRGAGPKVRMGQALDHDRGPVVFEIDIDRGAEWWGKVLHVQVLRPADDVPLVAHVEEVTVPTDDEPVISFQVDLDAADGDWVVLRIADPQEANADAGPDDHAGNLAAVAYASPFWLAPS